MPHAAPSPRLGFWRRAALLSAAHLVFLVFLHVLLETYEPEPNGFRFDSISKALSIAAAFSPPALVALFAVRKRTAVLLAALHTASALLFLGNARDPSSDLNFAVLLWWFPFPVIFGLIVLVDRLWPPSVTPDPHPSVQ